MKDEKKITTNDEVLKQFSFCSARKKQKNTL